MHPILIDFGLFRLSTYGVLVAAGYLLAILWLQRRIRLMPGMDEDKFWKLIYALFFGAVLGGKILYVTVNWHAFSTGEMRFFGDFRYGFVFFGGLMGSLAAGVVTARRLKIPFAATADHFGVALPMGHALGRLGCLAAGCCYGKPTDLPWGLKLGGAFSVTPEDLWGIPLHPTQLYEAIGSAMIAAVLWRWALPRARSKRLVPGTVFVFYLLLYSVLRFFVEFFRGDDRGWVYASLSVSQWISIVSLGAASAFLARRGLRAKS